MMESGKILQGRYKVDRQIGQGGMGAVYIATDERFGSTVAIKETLFSDEKFRKAFEREARLLNSLRHPALPRVSDHFIDGNGQFLVMEYIAGEDLSEQIEHEGHAFPVSDVLDWADQLLDALQYLHSQVMPVVHRDIKPQNLKLTPEGQVVLLDFGLAKGNTTNPESATAAKSVFGYSRNYASLEQIQGTGTDPRSDLYSLAATLYHLLAGNPPVDALSRAMNVLSNKLDPSIPISKVRSDVPVNVSNVLERAMSLNANERPESAAEMKAMLSAARNGEVFAAPATFVDRGPQTNLFNQQTQIQSEVATDQKQSEIRTETFSDHDSEQTKLRTSVRTGEVAGSAVVGKQSSEPKRRGVAIGATIGSLVLVAGAAGSYFLIPREKSVDPLPPANAERKVAETNVSNANSNIAEVNSNVSNSGVVGSQSPTPSKPELAAKDDSQKPKTPQPSPDVRVDSPTEPNMPDPRADPAVGDRPIPPPPGGETGPPPRDPRTNQVIPPEVWRKMTPLQRKKLRRALEMQREQQNRPPDPDNN